jgi:hypothetical protein
LPLPRQPDTGDEARTEVDHVPVDSRHVSVKNRALPASSPIHAL